MRKIGVLLLGVVLSTSTFAVSTPARAAVARKVAAESIVLLKNDGVLPLGADAKVDVVTAGDEAWCGCGGGSAWIHMPYIIDVPTGLRNAGFSVDPKNREVAVWTISRESHEGSERTLDHYYLSEKERAFFAELKKAGYGKIVVVLNVGTMISLAELKDDPAVSAMIYVSYPGMEGGNAIADVLSGKVNPSGRLSATIAAKLEDYPSEATWQEALHYVPYEEDIFVGYRYFYTIPGAAQKVVYPFGYGLSYTTFALSDFSVSRGFFGLSDSVKAKVRVTNTGRVAGRHSVLLYSSNAGGKAEHAAKELRAFAKTKLLAPGSSEVLEMSFRLSDLAYFDDEGVSGKPGSWVLDGGVYTVWMGGSPDDCRKAGSFDCDEKILSTPGFKLSPARLRRRLRANGSFCEAPVLYGDPSGFLTPVQWPEARPATNRIIRLQQVAKGEKTLDEFIDQMPIDDLIELLIGQPNILSVGNTCSIGVFEAYGVPGLQTADGPVGVRLGAWPKEGEKPVPEQMSTAFPATALTAGSFDLALQEDYGRVLGEEAADAGIDIHLAPGVCLARHPMCGRNFEYMGEDPYLAGKMAAAYIRGVQSQGIASTIKHFAGNNRENTRLQSYDIVSERAMREIYLKAFEIAVCEAQPKCLMTAYNAVNGLWSGAHYGMIEGILRDEWDFRGLVMTDWCAQSFLWQNIDAGNDVKMPCIWNFAQEDAKRDHIRYARQGIINPARIKASAKRVLKLVMESKRFKATLK